MDPAPQQVGVDALSHRHSGHRDARLPQRLHCLCLELGAVNSPPAAWRCLVHGAYVSIKSLMDTSILGTAQRINMTCQDAYDWSWSMANKALLHGTADTTGVEARAKSRFYRFTGFMPHDALPHAITLLVGVVLFWLGWSEHLPCFALGSPPK